MKAEKIILSFVSVFLGLLVAGGIFFFYQSTRAIPFSKAKIIFIRKPTPTPQSGFYLTLASPNDEIVTSSKTIIVAGKTLPGSTVVVVTPTDHQAVAPASNGDFSVSTTIGDDENQIDITAIAQDGEEKELSRTVTFSTQQF